MFLPGARCGCCQEKCERCASCIVDGGAPPECIAVTLQGFGDSVSEENKQCSECNFLDDGYYVLKSKGIATKTNTMSSVLFTVTANGGTGGKVIDTTNAGGSSLKYSVNKITIEKNGAGYGYTHPVTLTSHPNQYLAECQPAIGEVTLAPFSLQASAGSGAKITVTEYSAGAGDTLVIAALGPATGGAGYTKGATATVVPDESGATVVEAAVALIADVDKLGKPTEVSLVSGGSYSKVGQLQSVTVIEGGEYFPAGACLYASDTFCQSCPPFTKNMVASLAIDATNYTFSIKKGNEVLVSATQSAKVDGRYVECDGLLIQDAKGCLENGSITIQTQTETLTNLGELVNGQLDCENEFTLNGAYGKMPKQITLSLSGMAKVFTWSSRNSGAPGMQPCLDPNGGFYERDGQQWPNAVEYTPFCSKCGDMEGMESIRFVGTNAGLSAYSGSLLPQDCTVVLDLDKGSGCGSFLYAGTLPKSPAEGASSGSLTSVDCGGGLGGEPISVSIAATNLGTTVEISVPTKGPQETNETATAIVTSVNETGGISGISLVLPGAGYAVEIIDHEEPELTASVTGGTGAELSLTLAVDDGTKQTRTWGISDITVKNGGSGYLNGAAVTIAKAEDDESAEAAYAVVRTTITEPTINATAPGGTGAVLGVSLQKYTEYDWYMNAEKYAWQISAVTVSNGGTGYTDGAQITFAGQTTADKTRYEASAVLRTHRTAPSISASGSGTGAALSVSIAANGSTPETWSVSGVSVTSGGTGYSDGEQVTLTLASGDTEETAATAIVRTGRVQPTVAVSVTTYYGGSGAQISATLSQASNQYSGTYWTISSISVTNGGSGYPEGAFINVNITDGQSLYGNGSIYAATVVDGNGAVTGVTIYDGGQFFKSDGIIQSVHVQNGGSYYRADDVIESIVVEQAGSYYRDDGEIVSVDIIYPGEYWKPTPSGNVDADIPEIVISSVVGTNATATATIDTTIGSDTFGQITGIVVDEEGVDYMTSGVGWLLTINSFVFHLQNKLFEPPPPEPDLDNPLACVNFSDRWTSITPRVSMEIVPIELLARTYQMHWQYGTPWPNSPPESWDYCRTYIDTGNGETTDTKVFSFGSGGGITISLAPA